ncbi:lipo-like protein [Maribius pontilimi]|uniref:Lipo-like protein n=1 Tax=Palleronia pontilimi TaxID=1964209 RepID=A0A934MDJ1_9RHOB|nr:YiiX/YebB-like N1pC/P60 family cysteine hydrolase [Palleronia pontilimi]MBJ3763545.1 lipo-like protein [Palleronia pontilimi]
MTPIRTRLGRVLARYLEQRVAVYESFDVTPHDELCAEMQPADVLLVEGDTRISTAIKYLTTSTWSHAAFFVGDGPDRDLIEADLQGGVHYAPLSKYGHMNTRICRPVDLDSAARDRVVGHMRAAVGKMYDLKNIVDLARYLMPRPPVPRRFRRRMLALGSGDPTRALCSTVIAEAFQCVRYPILPLNHGLAPDGRAEILHIRHHSLFVPRDFDLSPYFRIVKPTIERGFDYRGLVWGDRQTPPIPAPIRHD